MHGFWSGVFVDCCLNNCIFRGVLGDKGEFATICIYFSFKTGICFPSCMIWLGRSYSAVFTFIVSLVGVSDQIIHELSFINSCPHSQHLLQED